MAVNILCFQPITIHGTGLKTPALKGTKKKRKCLEWFLQILVVLSQGWSIEIRALGCNLIRKVMEQDGRQGAENTEEEGGGGGGNSPATE